MESLLSVNLFLISRTFAVKNDDAMLTLAFNYEHLNFQPAFNSGWHIPVVVDPVT